MQKMSQNISKDEHNAVEKAAIEEFHYFAEQVRISIRAELIYRGSLHANSPIYDVLRITLHIELVDSSAKQLAETSERSQEAGGER